VHAQDLGCRSVPKATQQSTIVDLSAHVSQSHPFLPIPAVADGFAADRAGIHRATACRRYLYWQVL